MYDALYMVLNSSYILVSDCRLITTPLPWAFPSYHTFLSWTFPSCPAPPLSPLPPLLPPFMGKIVPQFSVSVWPERPSCGTPTYHPPPGHNQLRAAKPRSTQPPTGHHQWYLPLAHHLWYTNQPPSHHHQLCAQPPPGHHQWYPAVPPAHSSAVAPPTRPSATVPPIPVMLVVPALPPISHGTRLLGSLTSRAVVSTRLLAAQASTRATARAQVRRRMVSRGSGSSVHPLGRDGGTVSVRYQSYYCLSNMSFEQRRRLSMHN